MYIYVFVLSEYFFFYIKDVILIKFFFEYIFKKIIFLWNILIYLIKNSISILNFIRC